MEFTNASLEKVNDALKVVNEFTAEMNARAEKWLEANFTGNWMLPAPHIIFHPEGWIVRLADPDKVLNDTTGAPIEFLYRQPHIQKGYLSFEVPAEFIFSETGRS